MRRWILMVGAALLLLSQGALAAPTYEGTDQNPGQKPPAMIWHRITLDTSTTQSRNFALGQSCSVKFTKVGAGNVVLYEVPTSSAAYTSGVAETTFTASTTEAYTFKPGSSYGTVRAASDSDGSIVEISCLNDGTFSGGGGAPAAEYAALSSIDETTVSHVTVIDCNDITGAVCGSGGTTRVPFYYNGSAWVPFPGAASGIASVSADGAPALGADLDGAGYDIAGVADLSSKTQNDRLFFASAYEPDANLDSIETYGIREALAACAAVGGGRVVLPAGRTTINTATACGGGACTSPIIKLPAIDRGDGVKVGSCELVGFGSGAEEVGTGGTATPTDLRFNNISSMTATNGFKTLIQATAQGQVIRDFHITTSTPDSVTVPIWVASDEASPGNTGIDFLKIENVKIRDPNATDVGYGIILTNTEKGVVRGNNIEQVGTGLLFDLPPTDSSCTAASTPWACCTGSGTGTCGNGANNAMVIEANRFASGVTGIKIETKQACQDVYLVGNTIEGNTTGGMTIDADSQCFVSDFGNHWENSGTHNVQNNSDEASYYAYGSRYGGSATYSYQRTIAQNTVIGPDTLFGVEHANQIAGVTGGKIRYIAPVWLQPSAGRALGVNVAGGSLHVVDAGQVCGTNSVRGVNGDMCYEPDTDRLFVCESGGTGNICDTAAEWHPLRDVLTLTNCATATALGQMCVDTDDDTLYYGNGSAAVAVAASGAGSGDVTAVGDCATGDAFTGTCGTTLASNGNLLLDIDEDNNGTNTLQIRNGGNTAVVLVDETGALTTAAGIDADTGNIKADTGIVVSGTQGSARGEFNLWGGGTNLYNFGILAPATGSANLDLILPNTAPTDGYCLKASGTGGDLVWGSCSAGGFDATTVDAVTWSDGANASNAWTFDVSGTDPVVTWGNGTVDFSTPITATSFTADPSDTAEVRLTSATGADEAVLDFDDNGTTTSLTVRVDDGNGDDQAYVEFDGATVRALWSVPMTLASEATPTTDADGEISVDVDGWGTGFDAIEFFNGTASAYVVATTASDTPTNGQVPKWNTGGSITWENDSTGSGLGTSLSSSTNDILSGAASSGVLVIGGTGTTNNEKLSLDFESVANAVTITSSTGVTTINHPDNSIPTADLATEVRSMYWGAAALSADGTNCANPAEVTINSGPKLYTIICADNDSSTIYGSTVMPDSWDGGTVTFETTTIQTAANTSALNGDIAAQCRGDGETPSSTWGTEVAIDDAAVTGSNNNDQITSGAVTPAGTCAAGDTLYWRYQVDATGTTTAVSTLHFLGFKMEYTSNVGD